VKESMSFEEASVWCADNGVQLARRGDRLILTMGSRAVGESLEAEDWESWKVTFVRLAARLRRHSIRGLESISVSDRRTRPGDRPPPPSSTRIVFRPRHARRSIPF
jgi:hypothetical protein